LSLVHLAISCVLDTVELYIISPVRTWKQRE